MAKTYADFPPLDPRFVAPMQALGRGLPAGDPSWDTVWRVIVQAESGGAPDAIGDGGASIGYLQLNTRGGQGTGYSPSVLFGPATQAAIGGPPIAQAYRAGVDAGYSGMALLNYVAIHSGHPVSDGDASIPGVADYLAVLDRIAGYGPASAAAPTAEAGAPAAAPVPAPVPAVTETERAAAAAWAESFLPLGARPGTLIDASCLSRALAAAYVLFVRR
jgi:hypothetical protein